MIRLEYPKFNIDGLKDSEKLSTIKRQLDTLTNNIQLVLESISGDVEALSEFVGNSNEAENSENISTITETITSITETIGELEGRDYIVEQGTSGIWTYRKWNSGVAECWGTSTRSNVSMSPWGSVYYGTITADSFPSNLFLYAPNALMFARATGGNGWLTQTTNMTKSTTGTRYVIGVTNTTLSSVEVVTHAIGRWK